MAASLFMYSCESNDDSSPDNNPVDTEFSTDRSIHIKAFSSENARTFSTTYKETGCSECNADGTEFDAILFDKNRHKAQRKAKFYINKCRSASCMQGGLKQASA